MPPYAAAWAGVINHVWRGNADLNDFRGCGGQVNVWCDSNADKVSKEAVMFFRVVFFLISLGGQAPHVLRAHMEHTCWELNGIELTAANGLFYRSSPGRRLGGLRTRWPHTRGHRGRASSAPAPPRASHGHRYAS